MKVNNEIVEENEELFIDAETEKLLLELDRKTKFCDIMSGLSSIVGAYFFYKLYKDGIKLVDLGGLLSCVILLVACYGDSRRFSKYTLEILDKLEE